MPFEHAYLMARGRPLRPEHLPITANYQPQTRFTMKADHIGNAPSDNLSATKSEPVRENVITSANGNSLAHASSSSPEDVATDIADLIHTWLALAWKDPESQGNLYEKFLSVIEPPILRFLLEKHRGNKSALAQQLGWHRATVRKRLKQYKIEDDDPS